MKILILALLLAIASPAALARGSYTETCGQNVVRVGDPVSKLDRCGSPMRVVDLVNGFNAKIGERWEFERGRGGVAFIVVNGKIVQIHRF